MIKRIAFNTQDVIFFIKINYSLQIHPLVSCNFLRLFIQGELLHVVKPSLIIESWSRVAILLFGKIKKYALYL